MIGGVLLTPPNPTYEYELTLPNNDGSSGQVLTTDGNGLLSWTTVSSGSGTVTSVGGTGTVNAIGTDGQNLGAVGTIDYDSGSVDLPSMVLKKLYGTETNLRINVTPHDSIKDITTQALIRTSDTSTSAVVAKPSRNTVLLLDDSVLNATINTLSGVRITATKEVEEV